jgi:hypothetical protein
VDSRDIKNQFEDSSRERERGVHDLKGEDGVDCKLSRINLFFSLIKRSFFELKTKGMKV